MHAHRGRGCAFDPLYLSHETTGAHSSNTTPPPPAAARSMSECTAATAKRRTQLKSGFSFHKLEAATLAIPGNTLSCVQHFTFLNKSAKQNQISCSTEQRCNSGNRCRRSIKKITCNEFSARGPRMERCAESGNAWYGVTPAHAIGSRQLQGSLHVVFVPLALHHTSASHAQRSRNTAQALA